MSSFRAALSSAKFAAFKFRRRFLRGERVVILGDGTETYDDKLLVVGFISAGVYAEIADFRTVSRTEYDTYIVKTAWGYHKDVEGFLELVRELKGNGKRVVNSSAIIEKNFSKAEQNRFFERNKILTPKTAVVNDYAEFSGKVEKFSKGFVLKPAVSASSEQVYISEDGDIAGVKKYFEENKGKEIILQEYFPEVLAGEISVVVIGGKVSYAVYRKNKMFNGGKYEIYPIPIPGRAREIAEKIIGTRDYSEAVYLRVDMVERVGKYYVLEAEAVEPALFFYTLSKEKRKKVVREFVRTVLGG